MHTLHFIVNKNNIMRDPQSDFSNIPINTKETILAIFHFSSDWDKAIKVAAFFNSKGECPPQKLADNMYCIIPKEALSGHWFRVQILGNKNGSRIETNKLDVIQNGGK